MNKTNYKKNQLLSKLVRIERKCDSILSMLTRVRCLDRDDVIERLHKAARVMRAQCAEESRIIRRLYNKKPDEL